MKRSTVRPTWLVFLSISLSHGTFLTLPARAQETPASPRLALFPSEVVSPGTLQLEAGTSYENTDSGEDLHIGRMILRYGLGAVELQAGLGSYIVHWGEENYHGFEDLRLGMKVPLFHSAGGQAHIGGQGTMSVPTGIAELTAGDPGFQLSAAADFILVDRLFLSTILDWHSPYFAGDESWTITLFPGLAINSLSGGAGFGWSGLIDDGSLDSTLLGALFIELGRKTALELSGGRNLGTRDPLFLGIRVFRLLTR